MEGSLMDRGIDESPEEVCDGGEDSDTEGGSG